MDWLDLFYFLLGGFLFCGARFCRRGEWNAGYTSLEQTKMLQGAAALGIALHHIAQKTCGSWHPHQYVVHGLDVFVDVGYILVSVFFFCSGLGLYRSLRTKPDYLKGFFRRRVLPLAIAFYLSELIHLAIRLFMGERMTPMDVLWYLSGLHMANMNAWFLVVMPLFYLLFYLAFRTSRREGVAILKVFAGVMLYTAACAFVDHQRDLWIQGEWWYNSVILFPLGLLFGKFETALTRLFRRKYLIWLAVSIACVVVTWHVSEYAVNQWGGYYGETWGDPMKVIHRLGSAGSQWMVCAAVVWSCFLFTLKCRIGNGALAWFGRMSLDFYLMHGIFVEVFGYNFLDQGKSLRYIRSVPRFLAVVLACGMVAAVLFRRLRLAVTRALLPDVALRDGPMAVPACVRSALQSMRKLNIRIWAILGALILVLILPSVRSLLRAAPSAPVIDGVTVAIPDGFACSHSDIEYSVWKYPGTDQRPGPLILNAGIKGDRAQVFRTAEDVLANCDWMTDMELYVNPQGIRTVRGFTRGDSGDIERRYYVEGPKGVFLISMSEDPEYYDPGTCEAIMRKVAEGLSLRAN